MTKEKILEKIRVCAKKLGKNPRVMDMLRMARVKEGQIVRHFGNFGTALREAGLQPRGTGYSPSASMLLLDWGAACRELKNLPTAYQYKSGRKYTYRPFTARFGHWHNVPAAFRKFVRNQGCESEWLDVLALIDQHERDVALGYPVVAGSVSKHGAEGGVAAAESATGSRMAIAERGWTARRFRSDREVYGAPLPTTGMFHEPTNEAGVIFVFGMVARSLGIVVQRIQSEFPDCEAMHQVSRGRWQRVRIEFEFASRSFVHHRHKPGGCDLIVCWVHNWPECPQNIEVIELRRILRGG
jgi:hypothetical protein